MFVNIVSLNKKYLFSLGLECCFFIGLIASRDCRPNLYVRQANFYVRQYGGIIIQSLKNKSVFLLLFYIFGPWENKSFIRFVTDCPRLYVGLLNLIDGSASLRCPWDWSTQHIAVDSQLQT